MPPRRLFADAAHYGAMLSFLDGVDRLRSAFQAESQEQQGWYASWAVRSFDNVYRCLARSNAGRSEGRGSRPEFHPDSIARESWALRQQSLALVTSEHMPTTQRFMAVLIA